MCIPRPTHTPIQTVFVMKHVRDETSNTKRVLGCTFWSSRRETRCKTPAHQPLYRSGCLSDFFSFPQQDQCCCDTHTHTHTLTDTRNNCRCLLLLVTGITCSVSYVSSRTCANTHILPEMPVGFLISLLCSLTEKWKRRGKSFNWHQHVRIEVAQLECSGEFLVSLLLAGIFSHGNISTGEYSLSCWRMSALPLSLCTFPWWKERSESTYVWKVLATEKCVAITHTPRALTE